MPPLVVLAAAAALTIDAQPLAAHRWHDRLLVVFAADAAAPALAAQRRGVDTAAYADRDLKVVEVVGDRVTGATDAAAVLRRRFAVRGDAFRILLIGKDGHVARSSAVPLTTAELNATIDAMPMRRDEMQRR